jgi:hypothetical protein
MPSALLEDAHTYSADHQELHVLLPGWQQHQHQTAACCKLPPQNHSCANATTQAWLLKPKQMPQAQGTQEAHPFA